MAETLKRDFFSVNSVKAAKKLLGCVIVHRTDEGIMRARITETEAYRGTDDPGSHAFHKKTKRNEIMFKEPGKAYVYLCYGFHEMLNFVTEPKGKAGAVLIRALEPMSGIEIMQKNCGRKTNLTNGPGRLTKALAISRRHNGTDITRGRLKVLARGKEKFKTASGPRIGIKQGLDKKWRFWIKGSPFVSVKQEEK